MKPLNKSLIILLVVVTELWGPDCLAQRHSRKNETATDTTASTSLAPLVKKIGGMLPLRNANSAANAAGQIMVLRGGFAAERAKAAPERQQVLTGAILVCDLMTRAFDERRQAEANAKATKVVRVTPSTRSREKKRQANEADAVFDQAVVSYWNNRKAELISQIGTAYGKLQSLEARSPSAK
ncbi:MAG: hypothetical protein WC740_12780 [Verrucomicrobiia bacterium]